MCVRTNNELHDERVRRWTNYWAITIRIKVSQVRSLNSPKVTRWLDLQLGCCCCCFPPIHFVCCVVCARSLFSLSLSSGLATTYTFAAFWKLLKLRLERWKLAFHGCVCGLSHHSVCLVCTHTTVCVCVCVSVHVFEPELVCLCVCLCLCVTLSVIHQPFVCVQAFLRRRRFAPTQTPTPGAASRDRGQMGPIELGYELRIELKRNETKHTRTNERTKELRNHLRTTFWGHKRQPYQDTHTFNVQSEMHRRRRRFTLRRILMVKLFSWPPKVETRNSKVDINSTSELSNR